MAEFRIDRPASTGVSGESREIEASQASDLITLQGISNPGAGNSMTLVATSDPSPPTLTETVPGTTWTFQLVGNAGHTYKFLYDDQVDTIERCLYVKTIAGQVIPGRYDQSDFTTRIATESNPANIAASTNNANGNAYGWSPALEQSLRALSEMIAPVNVPKLSWVSATQVNAVADELGNSDLRVQMNDFSFLKATAPLSMDMATSGLGGLEASASETADTWYYLYAVPAATAGEFDVVSSPNPPPGGPTDFAIHRYLGVVRNDSSSDLKEFYQEGRHFRYTNPLDNDLIVYEEINGTPSTGAWLDLSSNFQIACPHQVALTARVGGFVDSDATQLITLWVAVGNPPPFTPTNSYKGATFGIGTQESSQDFAFSDLLVTDGTLSRFYTDRTGSIGVRIMVTGWEDRFLSLIR